MDEKLKEIDFSTVTANQNFAGFLPTKGTEPLVLAFFDKHCQKFRSKEKKIRGS